MGEGSTLFDLTALFGRKDPPLAPDMGISGFSKPYQSFFFSHPGSGTKPLIPLLLLGISPDIW